MKRWLVIPALLLFSFNATAQNNEDLEFWSSVSLRYKLNKSWGLAFEQGLRLNNNWSDVKTTYTEFGLRYRINKHWSFAATYRFGQPTNFPYPVHHDHRLVLDAKYMEDYQIGAGGIDEIEVDIRLRYQTRYRDMFVSEDGLMPSNYLRTKLSFTIDIDRDFEPYLGTEFYYRMRYDGNFFDTYRIFGGVNFTLDKRNELSISIIRESEFNVNNPQNATAVVIGYKHRLKFTPREDPVYHNTRIL